MALESGLGNSEASLDLVNQLRANLPESSAAAIIEGDLLMRREKFAEAAKVYQAGLEIGETSELVIRLYHARTQLGEMVSAFEFLENWTKRHPKDFDARRVLASGLIAMGRLEDGAAHHEKLLQERPDDVGILNNLAWIYQRLGYPRAISVAERAYSLAPNMAAAIDTLGWILVQQGNPERGLPLLREAHARASREGSLRYHLAVALNQLGRVEEARRELEAALETDEF